MRYLLDTTWAVNYLRGRDATVKKILSLKSEGLAISIVTLAELYEGVYRSANPALAEGHLKDFLSGLSILGVNEEICRIFGRERAKLRQKGTPIGDIDLLIASTSLHHDLVLLTDNVKHFKQVEGLKILRDAGV